MCVQNRKQEAEIQSCNTIMWGWQGCFKRQSKKIFRRLIIVVFSCFHVSCSFCGVKRHKHTPSLAALTAGKGIYIYVYINIDVNKWTLFLSELESVEIDYSAGLSLCHAALPPHYFLIWFPWRMKRHVGLDDEATWHGHAPPLEPISPGVNLIMPPFFSLPVTNLRRLCIMWRAGTTNHDSGDEIILSIYGHEVWANAKIVFKNHLQKETFTRER